MASEARGATRRGRFTRVYESWNAALAEAGVSGMEYAVFVALTRYDPRGGVYSRPANDLARDTGFTHEQVRDALYRLAHERLFTRDGELWPVISLARKPGRGRVTEYRVNVPTTFDEWDRTPIPEGRKKRVHVFGEGANALSGGQRKDNANALSGGQRKDNANALSGGQRKEGFLHCLENGFALTGNAFCIDSESTPIDITRERAGGFAREPKGFSPSLGAARFPQENATPPALQEREDHARGAGMFGDMPRAPRECYDPGRDPTCREIPYPTPDECERLTDSGGRMPDGRVVYDLDGRGVFFHGTGAYELTAAP